MGFKPNDAFEAELTAQLSTKLERAGDVFAGQFRANVSAGSRSGVKYPGLPRRSSSPSQYLQEQSGAYKGAIENNPTNDPLRREVGVFSDVYDDDTLGALEYGDRSGTLEGRYSLTRTMESAETQKEALQAMKGE